MHQGRYRFLSPSRTINQPSELSPDEGVGGVIEVVGARTHNLKNIDVDIPRDQLVVITGRSGSGKSSLAINTIFAEGQRQYVESLSIYSRQFFKQLPQPDVDIVRGLPPTLCLDQNHGTTSQRSTVGTITEIYDYLRLLMSRVGKIHCHGCGESIVQHTPQAIRDQVLELPERTKIMVLAPIVDAPIEENATFHRSLLRKIRRERLVRVRIDGEVHDIDHAPELTESGNHTIEAITDRIIVRDGVDERLLEAIDFADRLSGGHVIVCSNDPESGQWTDQVFSTRYACPGCQIEYSEIQPRSFSFNSPHGACTTCQGRGESFDFDPARVVPDRHGSVTSGGVAAWGELNSAEQKKHHLELKPILTHLGFDLDSPLILLGNEQWDDFLNSRKKSRLGLLVLLEKELATTSDDQRHDDLQDYQWLLECRSCQGSRISQKARSVFYQGRHLGEIVGMPIVEAIAFLNGHELDEDEQQIAEPILNEVLQRLKFLVKVGVGYLSLGRGSSTLSGGEHQRVRLAKSIGSGLTNVCYVLDEPSIGLHQRDNDRLIGSIRDLQEAGNSVLLVEHDEATIRMADHVIDIGPAAGVNGGQVVAQGTPLEICEAEESLTGDYLSGRAKIATPTERRAVTPDHCLSIKGASGRNLRSIDVDIPLGVLVCVTGVSGSGKSTLINQTLAPEIMLEHGRGSRQPQPFDSISGIEKVERLILVNQKPIGKSLRGCPATVTGIFDDLRKVFAATKQAKQLGFGIGRFTFNTKSGWCPECRGYGVNKIEMNFMPDFFVPCESCQGRRFNLQTLRVKFNDRSMADVLDMSVEQALEFFDSFEKIARPLQCLNDVGLGYLKLGQSTVTLSGGEAQRIKLATELAKSVGGNTLYILDEPTTGLHFEDIRLLLAAMNQLVEHGNSIYRDSDKRNSMIVIEHNLDVIKSADWMIDLGPDGGTGGGEVVASGTPEQVAQVAESITGVYLAEVL